VTDRRLPFVIAHRGASGRFPENTLRAFRAAIAAGADFLECDVRPTSDGVPVVFHDEETKRLARVPGRIENLSIGEVRRLRIRRGPSARPGGEPVARLDELAKLAQDRARLVVEIKSDGDAPALVREVVRCLERHGHRDAAIISFAPSIVDRARDVERWPLVGLILGSGTKPAAVARGLVRPEPLLVLQKSLVKDDVLRTAMRRGKRLWTYAVDRVVEQRRMAARGLDGIITNFPDRAVRTLGGSRARQASD
jgi:glycerophosphoryl diester phosphodiesterase